MRPAIFSVFVLLTVAAVAAPLLATGHPMAALLIRSFFAQVCHQQTGRSFVIAGAPVAVCVRCLGIYCGAAMGAAVGLAAGRRVLGLALLLNFLDVATEILHWHGNLPLLRFGLGLLLGWSAGLLLVSPIVGRNPFLRRPRRKVLNRPAQHSCKVILKTQKRRFEPPVGDGSKQDRDDKPDCLACKQLHPVFRAQKGKCDE
jgi:uncharacterized membrane protein